MKPLPFYSNNLSCENEEQVFSYLISKLKPSNTLWSYFINWEKVFANTNELELELELHSLNYLIGKDNL